MFRQVITTHLAFRRIECAGFWRLKFSSIAMVAMMLPLRTLRLRASTG